MAKIYAPKSPEITLQETAHAKLARQLAGECVVLLKNEGVLPLAEKGKIALFGNGARKTIKGGTGSGDVNVRSAVNIEQGLKEAGFKITTADWLDRYDAKWNDAAKSHREWIMAQAKERNVPPIVVEFDNPMKGVAPDEITEEDILASNTDTAVYVIARNSGEGADRFYEKGDYLLFEEEEKNLSLLGKRYAKVIVVLNIGGVMDVAALSDIQGIGAVVHLAQLGNIGGHVLADILTGVVNPSGKLTDTWAKNYYDYPSSKDFSHNNGNMSDEYYTDGIYVGYRYFDTFGIEPAYCFGYGMSYTEFAIEVESVAVRDGLASVRASVKNIGENYSGKEVVQVYASAPEGKLDKPYQTLTAFEKTKELKPGETQTLEITFALAQLASYSEAEAAWLLEAGDYIVRVGNSSRNTAAAAKIRLADAVRTQEGKNMFALDCVLEELKALKRTEKEEDIPLVLPEGAPILTKKIVYQGKREQMFSDSKQAWHILDVKNGNCTAEELTAQLGVEELAELCVGTMRETKDLTVVGGASVTVPGAAGDSSSILEESRGIKGLILADGPAGLRLQPHFRADREGNVLPGGGAMGDYVTPFEDEAEDGVCDYYQYCTAIPIGWALAQSWNGELVKEVGSMVGEEMELFHVDLWLAPALNIHRNPLCGRNFEYYSEDPFISGKMAAAITQGVQSHAGKGTTIKHFAVNNQEDNRYFVNAHVSERALREIYLKGFEIAVKESKPFSIMTSYNLLNGIHTANRKDLLQFVARDEWGFDGVVMTDWFTSQDMPMLTGKFKRKYPISASTGCIYAGNDLQMPGCQKNVDDIIEAVKSGESLDGYTLTLADLQYNAANLIRVVAKSITESA